MTAPVTKDTVFTIADAIAYLRTDQADLHDRLCADIIETQVREIAELNALAVRQQCTWTQCCDGCSDWTSGCGLDFTNGQYSDSITEWMNFCPFCGKEVVIAEVAE